MVLSKLSVEICFPKRASEQGRPIIEATWEPTVSSDEIGSELETQLRRRNQLAEAKVFDFPHALRNFQEALKLALNNQLSPSGSTPRHALRDRHERLGSYERRGREYPHRRQSVMEGDRIRQLEPTP